MPGPPNFAPEQVERAASTALGLCCESASHIAKGFANENWRLESADGPLLVKIGQRGSDPLKWRASTRALEFAHAVDVPAPELLFSEDACSALEGRILRIQRWVDGRSPVELDEAASTRFWRTLGETVSRLHEVSFERFSSRLDDSAPDFPTWSTYLAYRIPQIEARCEKAAFLDRATRMQVWRAVQTLAESVDTVVQPAFVHRDLHPDNMLATEEGALAGLLDFDMVEPWDPAAEWFKLEHWCFESAPERRTAFNAGYGDPAERHAAFAARCRIVDTIEFINMAASDAMAGNTTGTEWVMARLDLSPFDGA